MKPTTRLSMSALGILAVFALASCGKSSTAPDMSQVSPPPQIRTPVSAKIQTITVYKFPGKTQSGDDWDNSLIVSARRPDVYVQLRTEAGTSKYESETVNDAVTGTILGFSGAASGSLPATIPYGNGWRVYMWDNDFASASDRMGWITVNLLSTYQNDNAAGFSHTFQDSGDRIRIHIVGEWIY